MNRAEKLLALLESSVAIMRRHEVHLSKAMGGGYSGIKAETIEHRRIEAMQRELSVQCCEQGFNYADLRTIIPPPFNTNHRERIAILDDLIEYSEKKYG
tara:strand:+ start:1014 stop:1310 length:297 start_codon:yes stop_codon:yes gene_type:complete